jgi:hypothetical protein
MLGGLDSVPWDELEHAYGPAMDVPELIRALAAPEAAARAAALDSLYGNIWHQGTVYQATAYAVPFLIELVANPTVPDREAILVLLVHLANGHSYLDVHQHLPIFKEVMIDPTDPGEFEGQLQQELAGVDDAHAAVRQGYPVYLGLLADPDPQVRSAAAYLVSGFGAEITAIPDQLAAHLLQEEDTAVRATLILALGLAPSPAPVWVERLAAVVAQPDDPLLRLAAAMTLTLWCREETPAAAVEVLFATLAAPEPVAAAYGALPWANNDVLGDSATLLPALGITQARAAIPLLLQQLAAPKTDQDYEQHRLRRALSSLDLAHLLLLLTFEPQPDPPTTLEAAQTPQPNVPTSPVAALTAEQRAVLTGIATSPTLWICNGNTSLLLHAFGLPSEPERLWQFLGLPGSPEPISTPPEPE